MKKKLVVGIAILLIVAFGVVAFAEAAEAPNWYNDMLQWRQERLDDAVEEGLVTEEEAQWRQERWEEMDEFQREEGFGFGPGYGACHGENAFRGGRRGGFGSQSGGFFGHRRMF